VLAKRKTAIMKEIEAETGEKERIKKARVQKAAEKSKHMAIPDITDLDNERTLRKIATRGGISLYIVSYMLYLND
jgi:hypothetical protein